MSGQLWRHSNESIGKLDTSSFGIANDNDVTSIDHTNAGGQRN